MNKIIVLLCFSLFSVSLTGQDTVKQEVHELVDAWHKAAAEANFESYFSKMTQDGVFIGTDAGENWTVAEFKIFCKPYFDKGKAWDFKALERNVFISADGQYAWFDELLDTWMKLCRGSGVLHKVDGQWKIAHYVLSVTVPNETIEGVIALKKEKDSLLRQKLIQQ